MTTTDDATIPVGGHARVHQSLRSQLTPVDRVTPHPDNPRNGDQDAITASIRDLGLYKPITAQLHTGRILTGNHTYAGLVELGAEQVPVVWLDVNDDEALEILLRDNKTSDDGRYDDGLLLDLLNRVNETEAGLARTGYRDDDVLAIMDRIDTFGSEAAGFLSGIGDTEDTDHEPVIVGTNDEGTVYYQLSYTVTREQRDVIAAAVKRVQVELSGDERATTAAALTELATRAAGAHADASR